MFSLVEINYSDRSSCWLESVFRELVISIFRNITYVELDPNCFPLWVNITSCCNYSWIFPLMDHSIKLLRFEICRVTIHRFLAKIRSNTIYGMKFITVLLNTSRKTVEWVISIFQNIEFSLFRIQGVSSWTGQTGWFLNIISYFLIIEVYSVFLIIDLFSSSSKSIVISFKIR